LFLEAEKGNYFRNMKSIILPLLMGLFQQQPVDTSIKALMTANHVPCVGLGIIENGHISRVKVFGGPADTKFNVASQTKPVTAMLTLKLVQQDQWDLDEPLSHYWIDPDLAGDTNLAKLTTRLVLTHQTGFPNWRNGKLRFETPPGKKFGYSGEGFEYLKHALENKFHRPYDVLLDSVLLEPLGMKHTGYWQPSLDTSHFAHWHNGQGQRYQLSEVTPVSGADDLITTVEDYCLLGIAAMQEDSLFHSDLKVKEDYYRCLGWGFVTGLKNGAHALEHGGSDVGVRTMAVFIPATQQGVVIMTNGDNGMFVIDEIIRQVLPDGAQILSTMNHAATQHTKINLADSIIQSYAGTYEESNGKHIQVRAIANAIQVSGDGIPSATLVPESTDHFFLEGYDVQMKFTKDRQDELLQIFESQKLVAELRKHVALTQKR
jgi:CubicO group peptidase (beta-lactamase class C family)